MSRLAKVVVNNEKKVGGINESYNLGHRDEINYVYKTKKGLSEEIVREISGQKKEPEWMLERRLEALKIYESMPIPKWGGNLEEINFEDITYYLKPVDKTAKSWQEVPDSIKKTFEKIGVPEAEREVLAGVKSQFDSEVVYGSLKASLAKKGVVFLSMDDGLKEYPELVREYFGKVVPIGDNKLAALNSAVWSGGSFVYVPKGVEVGLPLQSYFRINEEKVGQFERTLIIADEGSKVHYIEGCFTKNVMINTATGQKKIEDICPGDLVMTHRGRLRKVGHIQKRNYRGSLYRISYFGGSTEFVEATDEHPFLAVERKIWNEKNKLWNRKWVKASELKKGDYLCVPIDKETINVEVKEFVVKKWKDKKVGYVSEVVKIPVTGDLLRLMGYYLAEGSISGGSYLNFSFSSEERDLIEDVKNLIRRIFDESRIKEIHHKKNNGTSVVVSSVRLCRIFETFGKKSYLKSIPSWIMKLDKEKQVELVKGWYLGDGNYYHKKHSSGFKEMVRINTTSEILSRQFRIILTRLGIPTFLNSQNRSRFGRKTMYVLGISGEWMDKVYKLLGISRDTYFTDKYKKKRASMFGSDKSYIYLPIKEIDVLTDQETEVYNFSVEQDESYVAGGVAVHNCSAPSYSSASLHAAVVEIWVRKGASVQYSTVQNWYKNIYNLVTKRAWVEENASMRWVDGNLGSRLTMKYPACVLAGRKAKGEVLSVAWAGEGQEQDTGAKMIHMAPETSSRIISKSISKGGGRAVYRGMVQMNKGAVNGRSKVVCDALILDELSRSDTYPKNIIMERKTTLEHEATVSRVSEDQLVYLMSRGIGEHEAEALVVNGFLDEVVKEIPMEYAIEMNRLVELEMEGSVG